MPYEILVNTTFDTVGATATVIQHQAMPIFPNLKVKVNVCRIQVVSKLYIFHDVFCNFPSTVIEKWLSRHCILDWTIGSDDVGNTGQENFRWRYVTPDT